MTSYKIKSFHPFEVSFCGFSGSGKTTLIKKLIERLSKQLTVGYMKHDAHRFEMDKDGKDTFVAKNAGAKTISITSETESAIIHPKDEMFYINRTAFLDMDVVLIEGFKNSLMKKILVLGETDTSKSILEKFTNGELQEVIALIGVEETTPTHALPYFNRDDISGISNFIKDLWNEKIKKTPLYGLVLGGGYSTRMGKDKGAMEYHGKTQVEHLEELLRGVVDKVFVSCRSEQSKLPHIKDSNQVHDKFLGIGPTGGILSAFDEHPNAAWLVVACDMPFVTKEALEELKLGRNPYKISTCFYNNERKWAEPLFSIYEPKAAHKFMHYLANGKRCPRKLINNSDIKSIMPNNEIVLKNINTLSESELALGQL